MTAEPEPEPTPRLLGLLPLEVGLPLPRGPLPPPYRTGNLGACPEGRDLYTTVTVNTTLRITKEEEETAPRKTVGSVHKNVHGRGAWWLSR